MRSLEVLTRELLSEEESLRGGEGGGRCAADGHAGVLSVRQRVSCLLDKNSSFLELGVWAGHDMYRQWDDTPAAGVVTGIGPIHSRPCMIVANDATVKAGAFFPQMVKKVLRAQRIAFRCRLPLVYLVDSAGVFLPMQDEIFPDGVEKAA